MYQVIERINSTLISEFYDRSLKSSSNNLVYRQEQWSLLAQWLSELQRAEMNPHLRELQVNHRIYTVEQLTPKSQAFELIVQLVIFHLNIIGCFEIEDFDFADQAVLDKPLQIFAFLIAVAIGQWSFHEDSTKRNMCVFHYYYNY